jgi:hypothetical protein
VCDPDCEAADPDPQNPEAPTDAGGDADSDSDADADADGDADIALAPTACGNGDCEVGEDGTSCGQDCCDAATACDVTWQGSGVWYCRAMNGGDFWWWTVEDTIAMCDEDEEVGTGTYDCGGTSGTCCSLPGGWVEGNCS